MFFRFKLSEYYLTSVSAGTPITLQLIAVVSSVFKSTHRDCRAIHPIHNTRVYFWGRAKSRASKIVPEGYVTLAGRELSRIGRYGVSHHRSKKRLVRDNNKSYRTKLILGEIKIQEETSLQKMCKI